MRLGFRGRKGSRPLMPSYCFTTGLSMRRWPNLRRLPIKRGCCHGQSLATSQRMSASAFQLPKDLQLPAFQSRDAVKQRLRRFARLRLASPLHRISLLSSFNHWSSGTGKQLKLLAARSCRPAWDLPPQKFPSLRAVQTCPGCKNHGREPQLRASRPHQLEIAAGH